MPAAGRPPDAERPRMVLLAVLLAQSTGTLPIFLVGSLAVLLRSDLNFSASQLGMAVSLFFVSSAILGVPTGVLCDRLGPLRSLTYSIALSCLTLLALSTLARSWLHVAILMAFAGAANAMTQPSTNLAIARGVVRNRGFAFGVKQAAVPVSTMLAGASVPILGVAFGWRWAFAAAALFVGCVATIVPRLLPASMAKRPPPTDSVDAPLRGMIVLSVAVVFANSTVTAMGAFFVESTVAGGVNPGTAGVLLMVGSISAILGRLLSGARADRRHGAHMRAVVIMMGMGLVGYLLLSLVSAPLLVAVASVLAFGFGWGWNGLFHFVVVSMNPASPAKASGISSVGLRTGGMIGPTLFGVVAERFSYPVAWRTSAALMAVGAGLLVLASRVLRHGGATYAEERRS